MALLTSNPATHQTTSLKTSTLYFNGHSPGKHNLNLPSTDWSDNKSVLFYLADQFNNFQKINLNLGGEKRPEHKLKSLISSPKLSINCAHTMPNRTAKYRVLAQLCSCLTRRDMDKSEMVERQESLHTATVISAHKSQETFISPNNFQNRELGKRIKVDKLMCLIYSVKVREIRRG